MRVIGLIGGMSWESTADYYRLLNRAVAARRGGHHSARIVLHSVDFADVVQLQRTGDWEGAGRLLGDAARGLEAAGAELVLIGANTMHHVARAVEDAVRVPLLHIVDPTGSALRAAGVRRAGLLGTRYTMELPFWRERLVARFGIDFVVPDEDDRALVHRVIYEELCLGRVEEASRRDVGAVIERLGTMGAEAVVLGCTELAMLVRPDDTALPLFDTTRLHAEHAVDVALGDALLPAPS
jgi:aspartate racemase